MKNLIITILLVGSSLAHGAGKKSQFLCDSNEYDFYVKADIKSGNLVSLDADKETVLDQAKLKVVKKKWVGPGPRLTSKRIYSFVDVETAGETIFEMYYGIEMLTGKEVITAKSLTSNNSTFTCTRMK